jgi:PAS domain S-box-containing protein
MSYQRQRPPDEEAPGRDDSRRTRGSHGPSPEDAEAVLRGLLGAHRNSRPVQPLTITEAASSDQSDACLHKLQKAEMRYRILVDRIPAITFLAAMDESVQEFYVSPQIEAILGFTQKEWLENPVLWYTQLHPEDRNRWQTEFAKTIVSGAPFRSEYRFLARDGRVVWVQGEAQMVQDEAGNPLFLQGIAFDITKQKEAEEILRRGRQQLEYEVQRRTAELGEANRALEAEVLERRRAEIGLSDRESMLRSIVDSAVDAIILIDEFGHVESFNLAAERMFGYAADEILGRNVSMLMPMPYRQEHDGYLANYRETGIAKVIGVGRDVTGRRRDGSTFPMELAVSVTQTAGGRKFTGMVRDVTERKRAETALLDAKLAAETANRLKGEFLANMSHEIRTPMNGILGMTELALGTELSPDQREFIEVVKTSADTLLTLINDILDFSKIEAGKLEVEFIEFDLRDTVFDVLRSLAVRAQVKGLALACDVGDDVPDHVIGDPGRLRQILINLVGNSLKFTETGEVVIEIGLQPLPPGDPLARCADDRSTDFEQFVRFSVRDTGIGIPFDKQNVIFEVFSQADGTMTRKFGGTGLGLSISRRLVELMGGRIWLDSEPGRGSTFHFTLQLKPTSTKKRLTYQARMVQVRGLRVLVVDDNATNRRILERTILGWDMLPTLSDSGCAALEAVKQASSENRPFQLVLLDATMPEMDGFTVLRHLRVDLELACATIMMLPSVAQLSDLALAEGLNLCSHLIKPIRQSELLDAIRESLSHALVNPVKTPEPPTQADETSPTPSPSVTTPCKTRKSLPKPGETPRRPLRVLLAEDHEVNQKLAVRVLAMNGYDVVVVGDGQRAVDALEDSVFDVVLMDIQMPVMDGFEATAAIRRREQERGGHIPVIAMTANAMKGDREECLENGFDDYTSKPIQWAQLMTVIETLGRANCG